MPPKPRSGGVSSKACSGGSKSRGKGPRSEKRRLRDLENAKAVAAATAVKTAKKLVCRLEKGPFWLNVTPHHGEGEARRFRVRIDRVDGAFLTEVSEGALLLNALFQLTEKNMRRLYEDSNFMGRGWSERAKREELNSPEAIFWIVSTQDDETKASASHSSECLEKAEAEFRPERAAERVIAFAHFRLEVEEGVPVVYLYELQTQEGFRSCRIGSLLLKLIEKQAKELNCLLQEETAGDAEKALLPSFAKILCTVLRSNPRALQFYKQKCNFESDETCPWRLWEEEVRNASSLITDDDQEESPPEYEILKKRLVPS